MTAITTHPQELKLGASGWTLMKHWKTFFRKKTELILPISACLSSLTYEDKILYKIQPSKPEKKTLNP